MVLNLTMKKPIIAVDIDDVLAQSTDSLRQVVNAHLGVDLPPEAYDIPVDYWGYYEAVWEANGLGGRISLDVLDPQMKADQSHVTPMPGAFATLSQLSQNYELVVVTARSSTWAEATDEWLQKNFPDIISQVFFAEGFEGIKKKSKGALCAEIGVSWLIDDNIEHGRSALELGMSVIVFGNYGWHHRGIPDGIVACKDWSEVGEYFNARV